MTIEALYKRIIASDELKSAFVEAVKAQKLDEFLKSQGCDAAGAEIMDFLKSLQKAEGELADDELNSVAGGCTSMGSNNSGPYYQGGCILDALNSSIAALKPDAQSENTFCPRT